MNIVVSDPSADVVPDQGDVKQIVLGPFTPLAIAEFCNVEGDPNLFHRYPDFAQRMCARKRVLPRGSVVVPAMLMIRQFPRVVVPWLGTGSSLVGLRLTIPLPAASGERIEVIMTVERRIPDPEGEGSLYDLHTVARVKGLSRPVLVAKVHMFTPTPGTAV